MQSLRHIHYIHLGRKEIFDTKKKCLYNARSMMENEEKYEENEVQLDDEGTSLHDDVDLEREDESLKDKISVLRKKLSDCEEEKQTSLEDLQRARADFLNSKRRLDEQLVRDKERATDKILFELIALADSFDTAMIDRELWGTIDAKWRVGVEAIHTKLLSILKGNNVISIDPIGKAFNPNEHEAVSSIAVTDPSKADTVISVLQKGFMRNGTIIRPAMVVVGAKKS